MSPSRLLSSRQPRQPPVRAGNLHPAMLRGLAQLGDDLHCAGRGEAFGREAPALLRVPGLGRRSAGAFGREAQRRSLHLAAGEDAVAGTEHGIE